MHFNGVTKGRQLILTETEQDPPTDEHFKFINSYRFPFLGSIIIARALLAAALSNDCVKLRLQL